MGEVNKVNPRRTIARGAFLATGLLAMASVLFLAVTMGLTRWVVVEDKANGIVEWRGIRGIQAFCEPCNNKTKTFLRAKCDNIEKLVLNVTEDACALIIDGTVCVCREPGDAIEAQRFYRTPACEDPELRLVDKTMPKTSDEFSEVIRSHRQKGRGFVVAGDVCVFFVWVFSMVGLIFVRTSFGAPLILFSTFSVVFSVLGFVECTTYQTQWYYSRSCGSIPVHNFLHNRDPEKYPDIEFGINFGLGIGGMVCALVTWIVSIVATYLTWKSYQPTKEDYGIIDK